MKIFGFLAVPLGWILKVIYLLVQNYGFALLLFTLVARLLLLPLNFKQQKSMVQMNLIKPKLDAIQKQYANNKEKQSEETMKAYKKYGINPAAGCLPLLIQFPILFALYDVIRRPLTYMWRVPAAEITSLISKYKIASPENINGQIELAEKLYDVGHKWGINFSFMGLDLSQTPKFDLSSPTLGFTLVWLVPVVAALTTWLSSKLMNVGMEKDKKEKEEENPVSARPPRPGEKTADTSAQTANTMTNFMPFMTLWFAFIVPAGLGLYWIAGNLIQIAQQYIINRHYVPKLKERMSLENEKLENNRKKGKKRR